MPSHPKPLQASLAGVGLSLSVHSLLVLNGSVLGVSGLLHKSARGDTEAALGVLGLVLSGVVAGRLESAGPSVFSMGFPATILAGFLVGAGTRVYSSQIILIYSLIASRASWPTVVLLGRSSH